MVRNDLWAGLYNLIFTRLIRISNQQNHQKFIDTAKCGLAKNDKSNAIKPSDPICPRSISHLQSKIVLAKVIFLHFSFDCDRQSCARVTHNVVQMENKNAIQSYTYAECHFWKITLLRILKGRQMDSNCCKQSVRQFVLLFGIERATQSVQTNWVHFFLLHIACVDICHDKVVQCKQMCALEKARRKQCH